MTEENAACNSFLLDSIGSNGKFQMFTFIAVFYQGIVCGLVTFQAVYIAYVPDHRCKVPPLDNPSIYNLTENDILNMTTPFDGEEYDGCNRYDFDLSLCDDNLSCVNTSSLPTPCDYGYHYDDSLFTSTVTTQFDLVCDRSILSSIESSIYMLAIFFGSVIYGYICDRFGRKYVVLSTATFVAVFNGAMIFSPTFLVFAIFRFIMSVNSTGVYFNSFIYLLEVVGTKYRGSYGAALQISFPIGYMMWSVIAYVWRDWHQMQVATFVVCMPAAVLILFLPESPIWLLSKNRKAEAERACRYIAQINGKKSEFEESKSKLLDEIETMKSNETRKEKDTSVPYFTAFKHRGMRKITIIMLYCWFVCSTVYYGIGFNAANLPGDLFVTNIYNGVFEIASCFLSIFALRAAGRITIAILSMALVGTLILISTLILEFCPEEDCGVFGTVVAFLGKASISFVYAVMYNMSIELYPTAVRGNANGILSIGSTFGSVTFPYVLLIQKYYKWIPGAILTVIAFIGAILCYGLPETKTQPMLRTIEEAEAFYKNNNKHVPMANTSWFGRWCRDEEGGSTHYRTTHIKIS